MVYKFTVQTSHEASELIADIMFDLGGMGVCINDPKDFDDIDKNGVVWDYIDDSDKVGDVTCEGFFDIEEPQSLLQEMNVRFNLVKENFPFDTGTLKTVFDIVPNVDWLEEWKKFYKPIVLDKISIIPAWFEPFGENYVLIQPGQAFGTGEHESTRICLELLSRLDLSEKEVADIGCGSGIIGMSALKLGAKNCYFSDLDKEALENLKVNLNLNGFDKDIEIKHASLLSGFDKKVDIIFANITADILMIMAPQTQNCLKDGGKIVVSGIISQMNDEVLKTYNSYGYKVTDGVAIKDWRGYIFERK